MGARLKVNKGDIFNRWSVIKEVGSIIQPSGLKVRRFLCKCCCDKNTKKIILLGNLKSGTSKSCGCYHKEVFTKIITKHGLRYHPLYNVHKNMKARCCNIKHISYEDYGGRGIRICKLWSMDKGRGLRNFIDWNESLLFNKRYQKGLEIDRINTNGNYSPKNCRWVIREINVANKRTRSDSLKIEYNNITYCFTEFYNKYHKNNVKYATAFLRVKELGWSAIDAVTVRSIHKPVKFNLIGKEFKGVELHRLVKKASRYPVDFYANLTSDQQSAIMRILSTEG